MLLVWGALGWCVQLWGGAWPALLIQGYSTYKLPIIFEPLLSPIRGVHATDLPSPLLPPPSRTSPTHTHCHRNGEQRSFHSCICSQNPWPIPFPDSLGSLGLKMERCSETWSQALAYSSLSGFKGSGTERANAWFGGLSSIMANTISWSYIHPSAKANLRICSRQHPCGTVIDWDWMGRCSPCTILYRGTLVLRLYLFWISDVVSLITYLNRLV